MFCNYTLYKRCHACFSFGIFLPQHRSSGKLFLSYGTKEVYRKPIETRKLARFMYPEFVMYSCFHVENLTLHNPCGGECPCPPNPCENNARNVLFWKRSHCNCSLLPLLSPFARISKRACSQRYIKPVHTTLIHKVELLFRSIYRNTCITKFSISNNFSVFPLINDSDIISWKAPSMFQH